MRRRFDEWWGSPLWDGTGAWRMSRVVERLVRSGRLGASNATTPVAEAKLCHDPCVWCPCGAYTFEWRAESSAGERRGGGVLRVNGGSDVVLLHLAFAKRSWGGATPPGAERARCLRGTLGSERVPPGHDLRAVPAPLKHNRPPWGTGWRIRYIDPANVTLC